MARPAGFEPTTPAFGGLYSIHLSYGRIYMRGAKNTGLDPDWPAGRLEVGFTNCVGESGRWVLISGKC
jgi:hypothetical protein